MASKNKGGKETRKPKADKKTKAVSTTSIVPPTARVAKSQPAK